MRHDLTSGSVTGAIARFSLPYLLSYLLQTLYGMADLFIIGQFDPVASTTAVSIGSQVMHMLTVMIVGLAMGATVMIGQTVGAKKDPSAYIGSTVTLFFSLSLLMTALLTALVHPIVSVMSTPTEAVSGTVEYLTVCFLGIPFITAYNVISSIFRGMGDSRTPMYFIAVACVCNIALDYLFNPQHKIFFKGMYNRRSDWENRYRISYKKLNGKSSKQSVVMQTKAGSSDHKEILYSLKVSQSSRPQAAKKDPIRFSRRRVRREKRFARRERVLSAYSGQNTRFGANPL